MLSDKDRIFTNLYGIHTQDWMPRSGAAAGSTPRPSSTKAENG